MKCQISQIQDSIFADLQIELWKMILRIALFIPRNTRDTKSLWNTSLSSWVMTLMRFLLVEDMLFTNVDQGCAGQGLIRFPKPLATGHQWQLGNLTTQGCGFHTVEVKAGQDCARRIWRTPLSPSSSPLFPELARKIMPECFAMQVLQKNSPRLADHISPRSLEPQT